MTERFVWHYNQVSCALFFFYFFLCLFGYFQVDCSSSFHYSSPKTTHFCPPDQSLALLQFKNKTFFFSSGYYATCNEQVFYPKTYSWTEGTDCCSWDGVTCDNVTGNVIGLAAVPVGLKAASMTIAASSIFPISNLSTLLLTISLYLSSTNFAGKIPDSIGNLLFLEIVHIEGCSFTGSIPTSIGNLTRATEIVFASNHLTGHLPHHVSGLSYLTTLDLSGNSLQGRVTSWLFTLPSLVSLDLSNNMLNGPINPFQSPNSLQEVRLQKNEIHGTIPSSIFQLVNLTYLDLTSNNLSGTVKFDMFSNNMDIKYSLPSLQELNLSNCNVNQFPSFLRNSEKLTSLDLSNGRIHGRISKHDSEGWKSLFDLHLSNNFLTHIELHPWQNITILDLRNNKIQGSILVPPPSTQVFLVSNNKLSGQIPPGTIPSCLGNFSTQLIILDLKNNSLEGHIHDTFANASSLRSLDLNSNKLEGPLPRSLANCSVLQVVNVGNNMISDRFPCWLGYLPVLKILVLRSNRFYGPLCKSNSTFTFQALQIIDLSHNEFTGFLPRTIFVSMETIKNVEEMEFGPQYIGGFYYKDSVTVAMKGRDVLLYKILRIFRAMDFLSNRFNGEIPEVLGNFKSLKVLNLSHNGLTGNIPVSLGIMTALESLDLSFNKLHGRIPEQLLGITDLASLNLSYNRLRGRIPRGNQFNTFDNDSYIGNIHLCGEPLTVTCSNDGVPKAPPSASTDHEEDEIASWFDWKVAKLGFASGVVIGLSIGYILLSIGRPRWLVKMVERDQQKKVRRRRPSDRM
ncbi:Receptor-like protein 33 [Citrus sinensis]|nr:Receptor-like protein 33 [Citrus sinensis]